MAQVQLKDRLIRPARKRLRYELARAYRSLLGKTCFVGVTGSCGKTTTTELIAGILAGKGKVGKRSHENTSEHLAEMILGLSKHHRYCVCELAGGGPGLLRNSTRLLKPRDLGFPGFKTKLSISHHFSRSFFLFSS